MTGMKERHPRDNQQAEAAAETLSIPEQAHRQARRKRPA